MLGIYSFFHPLSSILDHKLVLSLSHVDKFSMFRYSGDWSRIGVISKDTEDLLKLSAFIVFPVCIFLISSFSRKQED